MVNAENRLLVVKSIKILRGAILLAATALGMARLQAQSHITFPTADGATIQGDMYGTGIRGVVLVAHGGYSFKERWEKQARVLAAAGFRVLAFDTRAGVELKQTGKETACLHDRRVWPLTFWRPFATCTGWE